MNYQHVTTFVSFQQCQADDCQCSIGIYPCQFLKSCIAKVEKDAKNAFEKKDVAEFKALYKHVYYMLQYLDDSQGTKELHQVLNQVIGKFFNPLSFCCAKAWKGDCQSAMAGIACGCRTL